MAANEELIRLGDIDELIRHVDRLCAAEAWDELVELRDLSRAALETGRQLWPVATHAEYRLALEAPGRWAAVAVSTATGRPELGPLSEVAASTHTWAELAPHVDPHVPAVALTAHERVLRGEDLTMDATGADVDPGGVIDLPLVLAEWEPDYPLAEYHPDRAEFPLADVEGFVDVTLPAPGRPAKDAETVRALLDLVHAWTAESNGRAEAVAVRGSAASAVAALGASGARMAELSPGEAVARMAWAAASGGAHGRRRGMASGRFSAWWAAAALAGLLVDWPVDGHELGEVIAELRWFAWDPGVPDTGWTLRLAVEDPADGLAWAITASDIRL